MDAFLEETQIKLLDLFSEAIPWSQEEVDKEMAAAGVDVKATAIRVREGVKRALSGFLHNLRDNLHESHRPDLIAVLDAVEGGASTVKEVAEAIGVDVLAVCARLRQLRGLANIIRIKLREGDVLIEDAPVAYSRLYKLFNEVAPPKESPGQAFAGLMEYELRREQRDRR